MTDSSAPRNPDVRPGFAAWLLIVCVRGYQLLVSPWLGANCRYHPTCSAYAREALATHGAWRGSGLALRRLLRCHPWGGAGFDPVPPAHHSVRPASGRPSDGAD